MGLDPRQRVKTDDRDLEAIQDRAQEHAAQLDQVELLGGREIRDITVIAGANLIDHGLERQPRGWIVTDRTAGSMFFRTAWDSRTITLNTGLPMTMNLWIW